MTAMTFQETKSAFNALLREHTATYGGDAMIDAMASREAYLAWVARWKEDYKNLSRLIVAAKGMRKQRRFTYNPPGTMKAENSNQQDKRRFVSGDNTSYHSGGAMLAETMGELAEEMLEVRADAKVAAGLASAPQKAAA